MGIQPKRNSGQQSETAFRNFGGRPTVATTLAVRESSLFQHSRKGSQPATQRCQQPAGSITTTLGSGQQSHRTALEDRYSTSWGSAKLSPATASSTTSRHTGGQSGNSDSNSSSTSNSNPGDQPVLAQQGVRSRESVSQDHLSDDTAQHREERQSTATAPTVLLWDNTALLESRASDIGQQR